MLVASTSLIALTLLGTQPPMPARQVLKVAVFVAARRWPLSLLSLLVLGAAVLVVNQAPVLGLATVPACAVWVVFANARMQIDRVLEP